jgi:hypothetical protein
LALEKEEGDCSLAIGEAERKELVEGHLEGERSAWNSLRRVGLGLVLINFIGKSIIM